MRAYDDYFQYEEPAYQAPYQAPVYAQPVYQAPVYVDLPDPDPRDFFGLPYVPEPVYQSPYVDPTPRGGEGQFFGLPYVSEGQVFGKSPVSFVGPAVSVAPRGPASLGVPAGAIFAGQRYSGGGLGGFGGFAQAFKSSRASMRAPSMRVPYQRAFTVEMQEKLRRRRRRR